MRPFGSWRVNRERKRALVTDKWSRLALFGESRLTHLSLLAFEDGLGLLELLFRMAIQPVPDEVRSMYDGNQMLSEQKGSTRGAHISFYTLFQ